MSNIATEAEAQAKKELADEKFRQEVDAAKHRIKTQRKYLFPWRIRLTIERKK